MATDTQLKVPREMELARKQTTQARVANDKYGFCSICNQPMKLSEAGGLPVMACLQDNVVMPLRD